MEATVGSRPAAAVVCWSITSDESYLAIMTPSEAETWKGVEDSQRGFFVRFGISKANYGAPFPDRWFRRLDGGVLRPAVLERRKRKQAVKPQAEVGGRDENW